MSIFFPNALVYETTLHANTTEHYISVDLQQYNRLTIFKNRRRSKIKIGMRFNSKMTRVYNIKISFVDGSYRFARHKLIISRNE